ncbi:MAG: DUF5067 domain-containing protein [Pseudobutyrivibrio sp.]|nr:DUF5067 domain-containing protein [Pseudobutyrivibrio sp.]
MKIKRTMLLISIVSFSLLSTGCGTPLFVMTEDEEAVITMYAASMVSKFNKNQTIGVANARIREGELDEAYGLAPDSEEESTEPEVTDDENISEEPQIDPETGETIAVEDETGEETAEETESADAGYSFTDAIGIEGMEFTCSDFNVSDEFKPSSAFVLTQVSGKKYVVLNIKGTNTSDSSINFKDLGSRKFSLSINGGSAEQTQYTPLSNDLSTFDGTIKAGDSKSFVLVFLFSNSTVEDISSIQLNVSDGDQTRGTTI